MDRLLDIPHSQKNMNKTTQCKRKKKKIKIKKQLTADSGSFVTQINIVCAKKKMFCVTICCPRCFKFPMSRPLEINLKNP